MTSDQLRLSDFDYVLPKEMIAQEPLEERDESRLMVLNRADGTIGHHRFFELPELLDENCVLVFNESRVIPARLKFKLGNGNAEILLIKQVGDNVWECMVRPGPKFEPKKEGQIDSECSYHVKNITPHGLRIIKFKVGKSIAPGGADRLTPEAVDDSGGGSIGGSRNKPGTFAEWLRRHGHTPTPPYIKEYTGDPERYQTVYAKTEGSVAAPTAGFHFTDRVLADLKAKGVQTEFITLHVGLGTFQPVKVDDIAEHKMHSEWFELTAETADRLNTAKAAGKKIVAVGTTAVRVLESCAMRNNTKNQNKIGHKNVLKFLKKECESQNSLSQKFSRGEIMKGGDESVKSWRLVPKSGETDIFIYPNYEWKFVDQLITNFHVPKSTLLMLVSSFANPPYEPPKSLKGRDFILKAYEVAKREGYRFFSFGDSMLIV